MTLLFHVSLLLAVCVPALARNSRWLLDWNLDGQYVLTNVANQFLFRLDGARLDWNPLQGLGGPWYPFNAWLYPAFLFGRAAGGDFPNQVAIMAVCAVELFVAAYLLAVAARLPRGVGVVAAWLAVLLFVPLWGGPLIYPIMFNAPQVTTLVAVSLLMFAAVWTLGTGGVVRDLAATALFVFGALWLIAAAPLATMIVAPPVALLCLGAIIAPGRRGALVLRLGVLVATAAWLVISGPVEFLLRFAAVTPAAIFPEYFTLPNPPLSEGSIVFHSGWAGPFLFGFGTLGGIACVALSAGAARVLGATGLAAQAVIVTASLLAAWLPGGWIGPLPAYYELVLYPVYTLMAAAGAFVVGRRLLALPGGYALKRAGVLAMTLAVSALKRAGVLALALAVSALKRAGVLAIAAAISAWNRAGSAAPWVTAVTLAMGVAAVVSGRPSNASRVPWPPARTPIVAVLADNLALAPSAPFRGRVANLSSLDPADPVWFTGSQYSHGYIVSRATGNAHRLAGLWAFGIPTLEEYSSSYSPFLFMLAREALIAPPQRMFRNALSFGKADVRLFEALGVRYVIADRPLDGGAVAVARMDKMPDIKPFVLYELAGANRAGWSPTLVETISDGRTLLSRLTDPTVDLRRILLTSAPIASKLAPAESSSIVVERSGLRVRARSPGRSVLVLPFEFSHCWKIEGAAKDVRLFRANFLALGIEFGDELDLRLDYRLGPIHDSSCRAADFRDIFALGLAKARDWKKLM